jgi:AcrR family transcriptional regulator
MKKQRKIDRRIRRTRKQLYRALYDLIKMMPYDEISVSKIVDEADISRATFYLHYKDKHGLLIGSLESLLGETTEKVQNLPAIDIQSLALHIFQHIYDKHEFYQAIHQQDTASFVMLNGYVNMIQAHLQGDRSFTDELIMIDKIAHQMAGAIHALVLWWLKHDIPSSPEEMAQESYDFWIHGLQHTLPDLTRGKEV